MHLTLSADLLEIVQRILLVVYPFTSPDLAYFQNEGRTIAGSNLPYFETLANVGRAFVDLCVKPFPTDIFSERQHVMVSVVLHLFRGIGRVSPVDKPRLDKF
jgi:hypothetical protein